MRTWVLTVLGMAWATTIASAQTPAAQPAPGSAPPQTEAPESVIDRLPISLADIKDGLGKAPEAPSSLRIGDLPTFRLTIYGQRRQLLPSFQETLRPEWQAPIPGGIYNKEYLDMVTPPQARPYGAFTNGDLAEVAATSFIDALVGQALWKGYTQARGALRSWKEERIRQEVQAELEAFKRANGIVDQPQTQAFPKPPQEPEQ